MKTLSKDIKKDGFNLKQIKRKGDKAIYIKTKSGTKLKNYEVIRIGRHNGYTIAGQYIAPSEIYPSTSEWGVKGWTYVELSAAERKFDKI